jgi:hypothetical protein
MAQLREVRGVYEPRTDSTEGFLVVGDVLAHILIQIELTAQELARLNSNEAVMRPRFEQFWYWSMRERVLFVTLRPPDGGDYFRKGNADLAPSGKAVLQVVNDLLAELAKHSGRR